MAEPWTFTAAGEVAEQWSFLTDTLPAPTGPEQRRRLRETPRIVQQFDALEEGASRRRMETLLIANGAGDWDAPFVQDTALLATAASIGATTIAVDDTTARRFAVDGRALVIGADSATFEVHTIASVAPAALTFDTALARAWPVGTRVIPVYEAKFARIPILERFTGDAVALRAELEVCVPVPWPEDAGTATYRGLPVLELHPDWSAEPQFAPERRLAAVDNDTSVPTWFDQPGIPLSALRLEFAVEGRPAIGAFWSLLYALGGRASPIWVPSQAQDLLVTGTLSSAGATLDVQFAGLSDWPVRANRRDVRIELLDGTILYRRITDVDAIDANTERLTLDSVLGVNAPASFVRLVSFLALCRQDTDVNQLRWWRDDALLCELSFRGVLHDV